MAMNQTMQAALENLDERYHRAGYFPSAAVRIFNGTETLAQACAGEATQDALFDVASLTKLATTTGILKLIDESLIDLDDCIADHFAEIESDGWLRERFHGITIRRMLTHTSSLPAWYPFYIWQGEDFWTALKSALRNQLPVQGVVYSDINFILLGKLVELKRGLPLKDCLMRYIASPLGIVDQMMYRPPREGRAIIPSCYDNAVEEGMCAERGVRFEHWRLHNTPVIGTVNDGNCHYYFNDVSGHAGIFSTAYGYERLCQAYMRTEKPLYLQAQLEQEISPGRGIGFETGTIYPCGCGHNGFTGTSVYFSREYDIGAVAMTNRLYFTEPSGKNMNDFRRALHEMAFSLRNAGK